MDKLLGHSKKYFFNGFVNLETISISNYSFMTTVCPGSLDPII